MPHPLPIIHIQANHLHAGPGVFFQLILGSVRLTKNTTHLNYIVLSCYTTMSHRLDIVNALPGFPFSGMPLIKFGRAMALILHLGTLRRLWGEGKITNTGHLGVTRALLAIVSSVSLSHSLLSRLKSQRTATCQRLFLVPPRHVART